MDFEKCSKIIKDKKIVIQEKKSSKITFDNENTIEVKKVQVDGCLDISGLKCDWLIIIDKSEGYTENYIEIYIELKGKDVEHAFKQIENTIKLISKHKKNAVKYCYIVTTRCPLTSTEIQNKKKDFKKNYNAVLKVQKTGYIEKLNNLINSN